jgi:hypothetical protein
VSNQVPEGVPLTDPGNPFIGAEYPGMLTVGRVTGPGGERLVITMRSGPGTLTVLADQATAKAWAAQINAGADAMTGLIIPNGAFTPNGKMP